MDRKNLAKFTGITLGGIAVILVTVIIAAVLIFNAKTRTSETPQVYMWPDKQDSVVLAAGITDFVYMCADLRNDFCIAASSRLAGYLMAEDTSIIYALGTRCVLTSDFRGQNRLDSIAFVHEDGTVFAYAATYQEGTEKHAELIAWLKSDQLDKLLSAPIAAIGIYTQPQGFIPVPTKPIVTEHLRLRLSRLNDTLQENLRNME